MATSATSPSLNPAEVQRWTRVGVLAAFAMLLGYLETFIPIPIPGVKLGLANIAVLIALAERDTAGAFAIALIKVLAAGLLFGSPVTMAYSLAGTMLAFAVMAPLSRLRTMHIVMVSIIGALAHEAGQLAVAMVLLGTPLVWYSAPLLALAGCLTGALCGIVAGQAIKRFDIDAEQISGANGNATNLDHTPAGLSAGIAENRKDSSSRNSHPLSFGSRGNPRIAVNPKSALVAFIIYVIVVLHLVNPIVLACCLALAVAFCFAGRVGPRAVLAALIPVASILIITQTSRRSALRSPADTPSAAPLFRVLTLMPSWMEPCTITTITRARTALGPIGAGAIRRIGTSAPTKSCCVRPTTKSRLDDPRSSMSRPAMASTG